MELRFFLPIVISVNILFCNFRLNASFEYKHLSPNGEVLLDITDVTVIKALDVKLGTVLYQMTPYPSEFSSRGEIFSSPVFSPDSKLFATVQNNGFDRQTSIWETKTGQLIHAVKHGITPDHQGLRVITAISFSPDSKHFAYSETCELFVLDLETKNIRKKYLRDWWNPGVHSIQTTSFSPDGKYIMAAMNMDYAFNRIGGHKDTFYLVNFETLEIFESWDGDKMSYSSIKQAIEKIITQPTPFTHRPELIVDL